nr:integrase, catalytic region, zinc finger, CCHC-type, peptidase aspartic, catalytic [Tanacetum cinerariifolium]
MENVPPPNDNPNAPEEEPIMDQAPAAFVGFAPQWIGEQNPDNNNGWLEEEPEEEEENEAMEDDDEDDAEVINPYEEADPHNRPPPTSDEETEFAPPPERPETEDDLASDDLKQYAADIKAMNLILISIPNDICIYVDSCQTANEINVGNDGRIARGSYNVQDESTEGSNVQKETGNVQRNLQTSSAGNVTNVQCYNYSKKGHYAHNCPKPRNDFLIVDAAQMDEIKELNSNHEQTYHEKHKIINSTIGDDQINSDIIFDDPNMKVNSGSVDHDKDTYGSHDNELELLARNAYKEDEKQQIIANKVKQQNVGLTKQLEQYEEKIRDKIKALEKERDDLQLNVSEQRKHVLELQTARIALKRARDSNLYMISISDMEASSPICLMSKATSTYSCLWHQRLSHLNFGTINHLTKQDLVDGILKFKYNKDHLCSACEQEKSKKATLLPKLVPNDYTRYTWVYFLQMKDKDPEMMKKFIAQVQLNFKVQIQKVRTDNGTEFKNATLQDDYEKLGHDEPPFQIMQMLYFFVNDVHVDYAELRWEGLYYSLMHPTTLIPYPRFTKIIIDHYMTEHPDISRRVHDNYHRVENDDLVKSIFNSGVIRKVQRWRKSADIVTIHDNEEEEGSAGDEFELKRTEKGKGIEETKDTSPPIPIRSPRTHIALISLDKEIFQELTKEREILQAEITLQVTNAIANKTATVCIRDHEDHHDDDARLEGKSSAKRQNTSEYGTYSVGTNDDKVPTEEVSPELMEEISGEINKAKLQKVVNDMLRQRCNSREDHQYHVDLMQNYLKSDIFRKAGRKGPKKYTLSLHKYLAVPFPKEDIKKRTSRWLGMESCQQKFNLTAPTITFPGIERKKMFSITSKLVIGMIYDNSLKENKVMILNEIPMFCDATLKRVLEKLKKYNKDVKYGYAHPNMDEYGFIIRLKFGYVNLQFWFPTQSVRSSNAIALDSPYLLVIITETSQSRQYESRKTPTIELFDVDSRSISIVTVNTKEYHSDVLEISTRIMRRTLDNNL